MTQNSRDFLYRKHCLLRAFARDPWGASGTARETRLCFYLAY